MGSCHEDLGASVDLKCFEIGAFRFAKNTRVSSRGRPILSLGGRVGHQHSVFNPRLDSVHIRWIRVDSDALREAPTRGKQARKTGRTIVCVLPA